MKQIYLLCPSPNCRAFLFALENNYLFFKVVSMPDYLQTVMAGCGKSSSAVTTTVSANQVTTTSSQQQFQVCFSSGIEDET